MRWESFPAPPVLVAGLTVCALLTPLPALATASSAPPRPAASSPPAPAPRVSAPPHTTSANGVTSTSTSTANLSITIDNPGPAAPRLAWIVPANDSLDPQQAYPPNNYTGLAPGTYNFSVYHREGPYRGWWGNFTVSLDAGEEATVTFTRYTPYVNNTFHLPDAPRDSAGDPRYHYQNAANISLTAVVHNPTNGPHAISADADRTVTLLFHPKTSTTASFPAGVTDATIPAGEAVQLDIGGAALSLSTGRQYKLTVSLTAQYDGTTREVVTETDVGDVVQRFWFYERLLDVRQHNWAYNGSRARGSLAGDWLTAQGLDGTNVTVGLIVTGVDLNSPIINRRWESGVWDPTALNIIDAKAVGSTDLSLQDDPTRLEGYHGMSVSTGVWQFAPNASYIVAEADNSGEMDDAVEYLQTNHDPAVIVTSISLGDVTEVKQTLSDMVDVDTSVVVAAGNLRDEHPNYYPLEISTGAGTVSVASTNPDRSICTGSSPGNSTDIDGDGVADKPTVAAPGCEVLMIGEAEESAGSSWAAPYAGGVLALLTQHARQHGHTAADARRVLKETAIPTPTWNGSIDADNNGSTIDDDLDGAGGIRPVGAYHELLADDAVPQANVSVTIVERTSNTVTIRATLQNTGAQARSGGVYLATVDGQFTSAGVNAGEFDTFSILNRSGTQILELYTDSGNATSGQITISIPGNGIADLAYRAWWFDQHDVVYNPWLGRYERYIARDPQAARYSMVRYPSVFGAIKQYAPSGSGDRLAEGQKPSGTAQNPPYNKHLGAPSFNITDYEAYQRLLRTTTAPVAPLPTGWPMYRHDLRHYGQGTGPGPIRDIQTAWTFNATRNPYFASSPAIVNGTVYVGTTNYTETDHQFYALDADNGSVIWNFSVPGEMASSPAVWNGTVYFVGAENLYALNATTGVEQWNITTPGNGVSPGGTLGLNNQASPAVIDGVVYANLYDGHIYAVDAASGTVLWKHHIGGWHGKSPAVVNQTVYVANRPGGVLYALDARTGTELWTYHFRCPDLSDDLSHCGIYAAPVVTNNTIYVSGASFGASDRGRLIAINAENGTERWNISLGKSVTAPPAVTDELVYVGDHTGTIYAVYPRNGSIKWSVSDTDWGGSSINTAPTVADGVVYVGIRDTSCYNENQNEVWALDADNGSKLWQKSLHRALSVAPSLYNGSLYFGTYLSLCAPGPDTYTFYALSGPTSYPSQPVAQVRPAEIRYGSVIISSTHVTNVTVVNEGDAPLNITDLTLTGSNASAFSVLEPDAPFRIAPNESRNVTVEFTPTSAGQKIADLEIATNGSDNRTIIINLTGTGKRQRVQLNLSLNRTHIATAEPIQFQVRRVDTGSKVNATVVVAGTILTTGDDGTAVYRFDRTGQFSITVGKTNTSTATFINDSMTINVTQVPIVCSHCQAPTDPDGDGSYEDVNGDGNLDFNDLVVLFRHMQSDAVTDHVTVYDFNDNGRIDFDDIIELFYEI